MIELGLEDWLLDPRFGNGGRDAVGIGRYAPEVKPLWENVFRERTVAELTELVQAHGGLIAPLHTYESLFSDPRVASLDLLDSIDLPDGASMPTLRPAWTLSALSNDIEKRVPLLGEHHDSLLHDVQRR
jgi:crotonobetainyl-CoA:carnitine CoA-transferase CaiB-like acyl-CoA transferase